MSVHLQGILFHLTLYALSLTGLDLVFGVQWLEKLGAVVCDWSQMTMEFKWDGWLQQLHSVDAPPIQIASVEEVTKETHRKTSTFSICVLVHPKIHTLLNSYQNLFKEPNQLPPNRKINHHINLKDGVEPINIRPYRYTYFQKLKIENQVNEMLNSGLIRPSTNPFSSPVLLVRKRMGLGDFAQIIRNSIWSPLRTDFPSQQSTIC